MALFLLFSLVCIYYAKSQESQCMYQYLEQPPQDIICDPHDPQSTGLSLQCQVLAFGPSSSYTVVWFYYPTRTNYDGATPPRPISITSTIRDNVNSATSTTTVTLTLRPLVDGSSPGFYYCQVVPADQSETIPSDNFTLYAPEDNHYLSFLICDSMVPRFKSEVKCAVPIGEGPVNATGTEPPQNDGDSLTTSNVIATTANVPRQGDEPLPTVNNSTIVMSLSTTEAINSSKTVTCAEDGEEGGSSKNSNGMLYQVFVYVLTPIFLMILIVLVTTIAIYLGRKCAHHSKEQQKKAEENRTRGGQTGLGGLNQLRQSFHRVLRSQPRQPTAHTNSPLSSLSLQPNPSYLENSRNTALLQSRTYQASPLLETQRQIQKPEPCRQDITRQENPLSNRESLSSYEDNSYVIMRSSGTNSTYQSSGAYESML